MPAQPSRPCLYSVWCAPYIFHILLFGPFFILVFVSPRLLYLSYTVYPVGRQSDRTSAGSTGSVLSHKMRATLKKERGRKDGRCAYGNGGYKKHGQLVSTTPYCKSVRFPEEKKKASYFLGCWFPPLGVFLCFLYSSLLSPFSSSPSAYILPYSPYFHISRCYSSRPPDYAVPRVPARLHRIYTIPLRSCTPCVASYPAPASSVPCQQSQ